MTLPLIVAKSLRQHLLSTVVTALSIALALGLPAATPQRDLLVHLAFAVAGFGVMSWLLSRWGFGIWALKLVSAHWWSWLAVLLGYGLLGAMCSSMAKTRSPETAYLGLGLAVVLEAALFSPLIAMVLIKSGIGAIQSAALGTVLLVAALTLVVKVSGHNFSWMGVYLNILAMLAFGLIVSSIIFGFSLGIVFCYAMLALGAGFVVYDTSRVLNETTDDTPISAWQPPIAAEMVAPVLKRQPSCEAVSRKRATGSLAMGSRVPSSPVACGGVGDAAIGARPRKMLKMAAMFLESMALAAICPCTMYTPASTW